MIYQLAKTSPLLTGQVKMNMIMRGNKVEELQYTPISNFIPFNYDNPVDVLNYSHGDNVKFLYNKISDHFFKEVVNPVLSTKHLHRYDTLIDDTHENTYEMGMKRLEYQRYKKQFEFFCPIWCDNSEEFKQLKFLINLENNNGRVLYSKEIVFSDKIKKYLDKIHKDLGITGENNNLLYINFQEMLSHIKGLNVMTGNVQTIDTSYVVNNLLYQERPVLETDNMLVNLFNSHKIISTQLFNFNFVFDLMDFLPLTFINDFILERVNAYIDVYNGDEKVMVKDIYSNYENIPRYDIYTGKYDNEQNVLDYLQEYRSIDLITKNKLSQGTFHWCLLINDRSIFNLYNGFSPVFDNTPNSNSISCDSPDMFTNKFDKNKNPFGVFKYNTFDKDVLFVDFIKAIEDEKNYYSYDLKNLDSKEYEFFGNILISNEKLKTSLDKIKNINNDSTDISKKADVCVFSSDSKSVLFNDYDIKFYTDISNKNNVYAGQIDILRGAIFKIPSDFNYKKIRSLLSAEYLISSFEYKKGNDFYNDLQNFIVVRCTKDTNGRTILSVTLLLNFTQNNISEGIIENLSFETIYNGNLQAIYYKYKNEDNIPVKFYNYPNNYTSGNNIYIKDKLCEILQKVFVITQKSICYNALNLISRVIRCAKFPNIIVFDKSISTSLANSPSILSTEVNMNKSDKNVRIYRYDSNLYPMFIDIDTDDDFKNNTYWGKQYNRTIMNTINSVNNGEKDIDDIVTYSKYALDKFSPVFKSIDYFVINSKETDYKNYYLDDWLKDKESNIKYQKEISWYKNNSMLYLPSDFTITYENNTGEELDEDDIVKILDSVLKNNSEFSDRNKSKKEFIRYYVLSLYKYTYEYDYKNDNDITKQIYRIKFTLK